MSLPRGRLFFCVVFVTHAEDGTRLEHYALGVYKELCMALGGLIE